VRILFVSHLFPPQDRPEANIGGMQRVATDLYAVLEKRTNLSLHSKVLRTSWKWVELNTVQFLVGLWRNLPGYIERHQIEVILFSSMVPALVLTRIHAKLASLGVKTFVIVHGHDVAMPAAVYQRLIHQVFTVADGILPISTSTAEACLERGLSPEKCHIVHNGIDVSRFTQTTTRLEARHAQLELLGISEVPDTDLILCSVGHLVERKGFHWFIEEVMPQLPPSVHYWLVGDGPYQGKIREAIHRNHLEGRVRLLGRTSEFVLKNLYSGADLFIMPNIPVIGDLEGFGMVLLEAGTCGLPAIVSDLEGLHDVIHEGENGHFVPSGDAIAFRDKILLYEDRDRLKSASERAMAYIPNVFSWESAVEQYLAIFRQHL